MHRICGIVENEGFVRNIPLLYGERLVLGSSESHHLYLGVKGIEIDVGDDAEWARWVRGG